MIMTIIIIIIKIRSVINEENGRFSKFNDQADD